MRVIRLREKNPAQQLVPGEGRTTGQDCFLQKEARVCDSNAFVIEDSKFKWCFVVVVVVVVEDEQVTEEAYMLM